MFDAFILSVQSFVELYGMLGTFLVAVTESFIMPIPTATIIAPATSLGADPLLITIVATIGSVIGAVIGYYLGMKLGRPVANKYFSKYVTRVEEWFKRYGAWAVFIAAFTPIPFKVFTWVAGIMKINMKHFLIASIAGRFLQFLIAAYIGSLIGPWFFAMAGIAI